MELARRPEHCSQPEMLPQQEPAGRHWDSHRTDLVSRQAETKPRNVFAPRPFRSSIRIERIVHSRHPTVAVQRPLRALVQEPAAVVPRTVVAAAGSGAARVVGTRELVAAVVRPPLAAPRDRQPIRHYIPVDLRWAADVGGNTVVSSLAVVHS